MKTLINYPIVSSGLRSKTINILTSAGGTKFPLQQINELGLPIDAIIIGIWARTSVDTYTSSNNLLLVSSALQQTAYLALKDRANIYNNINLLLSDYYVPNLTQSAFLMQPVPSAMVDWNQSYIELSGTTAAVNDRNFELVVLYTDKVQDPPIAPRFLFRDGEQIAGVRTTSFEIQLRTNQSKYAFGNTNNIGLESDAVVLGIATRQNAFPLSGKTVLSGVSLNSSYVSLKKGTDAFIDSLPIAMTDYNQIFPNYRYFPLQPLYVQEIDWQSSVLEIKDMSSITNSMVFQYELIWYSTTVK